jgi:predicted dehydrogenase
MQSNKKIGIACLGITHPHTSGRVKAFRRIENVEFHGAFDESPLLQPFVEALDLEARSKEDILNDPNVDIVLIHPKSHLMAEWAIEAMEAGKAVLCEKPAGRGTPDTLRIMEAVERTGMLFQVGYCWRFSPAVDKMQTVLENEELGKVLQVRAHAGCSHNEADTDHMKQSGDLGGAFYVIGCHTIDRILYHFGMPKSVNARITKFKDQMSNTAREDAAAAILNYDDKVVTIDFMSWDPLPWTESWDITAYGTNGIMHSTPMPASYKIYHDGTKQHSKGWTHWNETSFPEIWAVRKTVYSPEIAEIGNPVYFDREASAFLTSLTQGKESVVPASQAHNINILLDKLFESASNNGVEVSTLE